MKVSDAAKRLGLPADTNTESVMAVIDARQTARKAQAKAKAPAPPPAPPGDYPRSWLTTSERRRAEGKPPVTEIRSFI